MSSITTYIRDKHALWYKFLLFICSTIVIVLFFPKEEAFKYEVEKLLDKPWNYEQFVAPFDFPIYKTSEELNKEKKEIKLASKFYFFRNNTINSTNTFDAFLLRIKNKKTLALCKMIFDTIVQKGIIETSDITDGQKNSFLIVLIEKNQEEEISLGDFFTLKKADAFVIEKLKFLPPIEANMLRDSIENFISVNVFYNKEFSNKVMKQNLENILPTHGKIIKGQTIIDKGEIITAEKMQVLNSLRIELKQNNAGLASDNYLLLLGQILVVAMCLSMMMLFLLFFRKNIFSLNSEITFIFLLIILFVVVCCKVTENAAFSIFFIPFTIAPIIIRTFFDSRTALFAHLNIIILCSFLAPERFEFIFIQLFAGIGAIFSVAALSKRSQLFNSIIAVFVTYVIGYVSLQLIFDSRSASFKLIDFLPLAISSATVLFAYPLIYISEKVFGFVSDFTLLELADSNSPLLRDLAQKAPGTFQHSMQVASLAEEAIHKVGGSALLVRAGAMYHDIGKTNNPRYFIENMVGGINPHDDLAFEDSAKIIIQHVIDGVEIAKENKLPNQLIDFIRTHHGSTLTRYFFRNYQLQHKDEVIDENKFRYPGPIPFSKETAVLMMADSVEAASRSLKTYDAQNIDKLVDGVIDYQINENQFLNSDITFRDINQIKKIFKKRLMNIYHVRVEYPR